MISPDGRSIEAYFVNNTASGKGRMVNIDEEVYEGEFKAGVPHGTGTYTWPMGSKYTGDYKDGKR